MLRSLLIITALLALALGGCGGGGGGSAPLQAPVSKAVTKVFVYGNMSSPTSFGNLSSAGRIATIQATMTVPNGVMVNYSSAPGATSGVCFLRKGAIVPTAGLSTNDFSFSSYDIATRVLTISMFNNGRVKLKINTNGNGLEIASVVSNLATTGVTPSLMPLMDQTAVISEEMPDLSLDYLMGRRVNYTTTYQ